MIAIIDYDAGNLSSVAKGLDHIGAETIVTNDGDLIRKADKIILPGVGAFGDAMAQIKEKELDVVIRDVVRQGKPFLGICLGLQVLFAGSEENPEIEGLSLLPGQVKRLPSKPGFKIPHIGWNTLEFQNDGRLFRGIPEDAFVYFVHSYYLEAADESIVTATTEYTAHIHASIEYENIFGCQFHPEKSGEVGLEILRNFARL